VTETIRKRFSACSGRNATHTDCTRVYIGTKNAGEPRRSGVARYWKCAPISDEPGVTIEVRYVCNCWCNHRDSVQPSLIPAPEESDKPEPDADALGRSTHFSSPQRNLF